MQEACHSNPSKYDLALIASSLVEAQQLEHLSSHCMEGCGFHSHQALRTLKTPFLSHFYVCFSLSQFPTASPSASNPIFPVKKYTKFVYLSSRLQTLASQGTLGELQEDCSQTKPSPLWPHNYIK